MYGGSSQLRGNASATNAASSSSRAAASGSSGAPPSNTAGRQAEGPGGTAESASVRYARLSQRKKDTGGNAYPPPPPVGSYSGLQNTSVNIANAFKAATSGLGGVVTGGRKEDFPDPDEEEDADEEENDVEEEEDGVHREEGQAGPSGASGKAPSSAGRKRKVCKTATIATACDRMLMTHHRNTAIATLPTKISRVRIRAATIPSMISCEETRSARKCTRTITITLVRHSAASGIACVTGI